MKRITFILSALMLLGSVIFGQTNTHSAGWQSRLVIATTDSAVRLTSTGITAKWVIVQALPTNTNRIAVGVTKGTITAASLDTPIVVVSASHGLTTGQRVSIVGVRGNTATNGHWLVTVVSVDTFSLDASEGNAAYQQPPARQPYGTWTDISAATGIEKGDQLYPGGTTVIGIDDVSQVWVNGTAADGVTWRWGVNATPSIVPDIGAQPLTATVTGIDSIEVTLDRVDAKLPASKPRFVNDSLITTNATHTAYAAGDAISDSTSSPDIRLFTGAFLATNTPAKAEWLIVRTDTNVTATLTFAFYDTVVTVNNDNAAYQTLTASSLRFLGEATVYLTAGGTGSTASQGTTYIGDIVRSPGTTNLYYRVKTLTAVTLKHKGRLDSTLKLSYP